MRNALIAFIAASAVAFTVVCLPSATPVFAAFCDDLIIIYARGSGQSLGASEYQTLKSNLELGLVGRQDITYSFYELGTAPQNEHQYPAVALDFKRTIAATISAGSAFEYGESVTEGSAELIAYINNVSASCPKTKFVLTGYSQGAQVISASTLKIDPAKIIYAATFGDPKLYLPEGWGINPPACSGRNLSDYRAYAPNCKTYAGSLGAKKPYEETGWSTKLGLYCKDKDLICGAGLNLGSSGENENIFERIRENLMAAHTSYASSGVIKLAATSIVDKINAQIPKTNTETTQKEVLVLIDYASVDKSYPNKSTAVSLVREIYHKNDHVSVSFYHTSLNRNEDRVYYYSRLQETLNPILGPVDNVWAYDFRGTVDQEDNAKTRLDHLLNREDSPLKNVQTVYIISDEIPDTESPYRGLELIMLDLDTSNPENLISKRKSQSTKNIAFAGSAPASISKLAYTLSGNKIILSYKLNAAAAYLSLNDAPLGLTDQETLEITDVHLGDKIILRPIDEAGNFGEESEIIIEDQSSPGYGSSQPTFIQSAQTILVPNCGRL